MRKISYKSILLIYCLFGLTATWGIYFVGADLSLASSSYVSVDFDPDTLNRKSQGKWVTVYIDLPNGYNMEDIDISTIMLNGEVPAEEKPTGIDEDGILMVKFDRQAVKDLLESGENVLITVTGEFSNGNGNGNGLTFEGTDTIRVIH